MKAYSLNAQEGIYNLKDRIFNSPDKSISSLEEAINVKIDNDGFWSLREGRSAKKFSGTPHSIDKQGSGLFVDTSILYRLNSDYSATAIATMSNNNEMVYAKLPEGGIVCSNGTDIGIVKNDVYTAFPYTTGQYKRKMPAGQLLLWHYNTLYVASGGTVFYSDPKNYGVMDTRSKKKRFKGYVTLMVSVDDGIYISDSYDTFFYSGKNPHDMPVKVVADYPAIYGMYATIERRLVGDGSAQTKIVYWQSSKGICMGTSGGNFTNLTIQKYGLSNIPLKGTAYFRNNNGIPQFIAVGII